ncbi:MAG TPA: hypothetical protein VG056_13935, partial [Pirellulales bacterium]|nr:hypothetical protein [Pirellulales bacterium]
MTAARIITALLAVCCCIGCQSHEDWLTAYKQTHQNGLKVIQQAGEMQELFGAENVDHFITHYGFPGEKTNSWKTNVWLGGRYELGMEVEVVVDYQNHGIERVVGKPKFFLSVVQRVDVLPDGRAVIYYDERQARQFGPDEWATVYKNKGDFSKIGVTIVRDAPIPGFDE